jgi:hypothetical protein
MARAKSKGQSLFTPNKAYTKTLGLIENKTVKVI